jgi:hypothetical protein
MKIRIIATGLLAILVCSCASPGYLPSSDKIDVNAFGSYIKVWDKTASIIDGELIAVDSNELFVLREDTKTCVTIPIADINRFTLQYAQPKHYGWTIPLFTLATISHGWIAIFTAPVNLIVTTSVTASARKAFQYNNKKITYDELNMFARFPQGIPSDINIASVK